MDTIDGIDRGHQSHGFRRHPWNCATCVTSAPWRSSLNFTRAAERLHVTQSTLSHQIKQLEDELGTQLFDRSGKRVALTESGEAFLHHATRALAGNRPRPGRAARATRRRYRASCVSAHHADLQPRLHPDCIAALQPRYPGVRVVVEELAADLIAQRLQQGTLDLGIAYRPATPGAAGSSRSTTRRCVLVVAEGHPLARRKRVRMVELHRLPMVLLPASFATRQMLDECFRSCGAEPQVVAEINALAPIMGLVGKTRLAAIVAANAVQPNAGLAIVRLESPTPVRTPGMLWSPPARESAATRAFSAIVRKVAFRTSLLERGDAKG
jgi:LysR family cyn operon transcriptional activator